MALWDDLRGEVKTIINKSTLDAEIDLAMRQAIRAAHKSGKYWRDLAEVSLTLPTTDAVQSVDLSTYAPNFRQTAYLKIADQDIYYSPVQIDDLVDADGFVRANIYWGLGASLKIRGESPMEQMKLCYYRYPIVSPLASMDSWIADQHRDLIVAWTASTILGMIGEQEIKGRMDTLAAIAFADLQQDNLEIHGR